MPNHVPPFHSRCGSKYGLFSFNAENTEWGKLQSVQSYVAPTNVSELPGDRGRTSGHMFVVDGTFSWLCELVVRNT